MKTLMSEWSIKAQTCKNKQLTQKNNVKYVHNVCRIITYISKTE